MRRSVERDQDPLKVLAATAERRRQLCLFLVKEHEALARVFGRGHFSNPRWEIALQIYLAALDERDLYQSAIAPEIPAPSAHRLAAEFELKRFVDRISDSDDNRRRLVKARTELVEPMHTVMDDLHAHVRALFLQKR